MEFTPNLNLPKPADGEDGWGDEYRAAMDTLDEVAGRPILGEDEAALTVLNGYGSGAPFTVGAGQSAIVPLRVLKDPQGWVVPDAYVTASYSIPANSSWLLPPGIYTVSADFLYFAGPNVLHRCFFEWTDWTVVGNVDDDVYAGSAYFYSGAHGTESRVPETIGIYRQTQAMYDGGQGMCVRAVNQSGTDMIFNYCDVFIVRIR